MSKSNRFTKTKRYAVDVIFIDPHGDIGKAIKSEDWVSGFSYAVRYIEHFGTIKIKNFVDSKFIQNIENSDQKREVSNRFSEDLNRLSTVNIVFMLFALGLVNANAYLDLRKIIVERNKLIHPLKKGVGFQNVEEEKNKRKSMLQQAQKLIEEIQQIKV